MNNHPTMADNYLTAPNNPVKRRRNRWKRLKKVIIPATLKAVRKSIYNYRHRHIFKLGRYTRTDLLVKKLQEDIKTLGFE